MNITGAGENEWLLCMLEYVIYVRNHTTMKSLNWKTPLEALTGVTPDISIIYQMFYQAEVYFLSNEVGFPSDSTEEIRFFVGFSKNAIQTLRLAGLDQPDSVLMTDEALGFVAAAEELKLNHVLCRWHYMDGIHTAIRSVPRELMISEKFYHVLHKNFENEHAFVAYAKTLIHLCKPYDAANKLTERIYENHHKVCHFFTTKVCTCAHSSAVRARARTTESRVEGC
jgi:hypothetical protein